LIVIFNCLFKLVPFVVLYYSLAFIIIKGIIFVIYNDFTIIGNFRNNTTFTINVIRAIEFFFNFLFYHCSFSNGSIGSYHCVWFSSWIGLNLI